MNRMKLYWNDDTEPDTPSHRAVTDQRIGQTAIVHTQQFNALSFCPATRLCLIFSPGAPLDSSAASIISHLPWFPVAIWPRWCVPAAWSPTPLCLVVCDRCHERVGVMISQEPSFLSKTWPLFMRFCLPMLNPCLRRLLKSSLALTTSLTSCNMPARRP